MDVWDLQRELVDVRQRMARDTASLDVSERLSSIETALTQLATVLFEVLSQVNRQSRFPR